MTRQQIAVALGIGLRAVRKRMKALGVEPSRRMRGNGGDLFDYDVGQLPAEWQERIRAREARRGQGAGNQETTAALALSSSQPISQPAAPASAAGLSPAPSPRRGNDGGEGGGHPTVALSLFPAAALTEKEQHELEALPSKQQEQAIERHQAIKPATQREWQALPAAQRRTLRRERLMRQLAERAGVGVRTIRRWVSRYDRGGICALADRKRRDEGDTSLMRAQQRYLIVLYDSQEQRSIRECWQLLCLDIDAGGLEGPKPSYGVCKAFLRRHNPAVIKELFREGEKRFYDRHDPWAQRDVSQLPPNYWWMADFWERDVRTRSPQERLHRRWRCVIQDIRSRAWVGWAEGDAPSTQLFKSALGRAINTHGLPGYWDDQGAFQLGHLSIDNGKEFISKEALGKPKRWRFDVAEDKELTGFLGLLGFDTAEPERPSNLHRTQPRNSRGKSYIESSFNLLARFDRRLPGATGNRSHNKPEKLAAEERLHKEYCEGLRPETLLLSDEESGKALDLFMEWCNWGRRHGATKATPGQMMARGKPHPKPEPAALEILLWYHRQVKVRGDKVTVRFGSVARTFAHDKLLLLSGEMVEVHCDPANPDLALVFHRGRPYCKAEPLAPLPQGATREQLEALGKRQRRLRKQLRQMMGELREGVDVLTERDAVELLAREARERRLALTAGNGKAPKAELPGFDQAARALKAEEKDRRELQAAEPADEGVELPDYGAEGDRYLGAED